MIEKNSRGGEGKRIGFGSAKGVLLTRTIFSEFGLEMGGTTVRLR